MVLPTILGILPSQIGISPCFFHIECRYLQQEKKKGLGYDNVTDDTRSLYGWTWNRSDESKSSQEASETKEEKLLRQDGRRGCDLSRVHST